MILSGIAFFFTRWRLFHFVETLSSFLIIVQVTQSRNSISDDYDHDHSTQPNGVTNNYMYLVNQYYIDELHVYYNYQLPLAIEKKRNAKEILQRIITRVIIHELCIISISFPRTETGFRSPSI